MTVTLHFSAEVESRLRAEAARRGLSLEEHLAKLVEGSVAPAPGGTPVPAESWEAAWRAWSAGHKSLPAPADDDRGTLYAGCGE